MARNFPLNNDESTCTLNKYSFLFELLIKKIIHIISLKGVDYMNLKVDSNAFTKLNGMTGISYVNIENLNNELKEKSLKGNIKISGKYLGDKIEDDNNLNSFENIIPYEI